MHRHNAVFAGLGLDAAAQTTIFAVIRKWCQRQKLGDAKARVAQHEYRVGPRKSLFVKLPQAGQLGVGKGALFILRAHAGHLDKRRIVLDHNIALESAFVQRTEQRLDIGNR